MVPKPRSQSREPTKENIAVVEGEKEESQSSSPKEEKEFAFEKEDEESYEDEEDHQEEKETESPNLVSKIDSKSSVLPDSEASSEDQEDKKVTEMPNQIPKIDSKSRVPSNELDPEESSEDQEDNKVKEIPNPDPKIDSKSSVPDNELGSETESGSEYSPSSYKIQPISRPSKKRINQEGSVQSSKKPKIEQKKSVPSSHGGCINRLWSDEDEICVLNGIINFKNVKGLDPNLDIEAFHSYIKGKLKVYFSKEQLRSKIRNLKRRFLNALKKGENTFDLSKKIWGDALRNGEVGKNGAHKNLKKQVVEGEKSVLGEKRIANKEIDSEELDFWSKYPFLATSFHGIAMKFVLPGMSDNALSLVKERLSSIGNMKAKELDDEWKQLFLEEAELVHKVSSLMAEQFRLASHQ